MNLLRPWPQARFIEQAWCLGRIGSSCSLWGKGPFKAFLLGWQGVVSSLSSHRYFSPVPTFVSMAKFPLKNMDGGHVGLKPSLKSTLLTTVTSISSYLNTNLYSEVPEIRVSTYIWGVGSKIQPITLDKGQSTRYPETWAWLLSVRESLTLTESWACVHHSSARVASFGGPPGSSPTR